jgi:PAS domain S-box-containing protein
MRQREEGDDSSEKYRQLIDSIDGIVWEANPEFSFTFVSKQAERILGYPTERWVSEPGFWASILHPEDRARTMEFCREQTKLLLPHIFEYRALAADGREVWLRDMVSVESRGGEPCKLRGIMVDISSLRVAEARLIQSEQRFRGMVESSQEGIWIIDQNTATTFVNPKLVEILGYSEAEMLGRSLYDFMDADKVELARESLRRRESGVVEQMDFEFRRKNGRKAWVSMAANPIFDGERKYVGAMAMVGDVSDRRRKENLLSAQRKVFENLLGGQSLAPALDTLLHTIEDLGDGMTTAIYLLDESGQRLTVGAAPSLPDGLRRAVGEGRIRSDLGTSFVAVFRKAFVVTEDVNLDPLWAELRDLARENNVRSCWSQPIFNREGGVLGVFSMYFREPRRPDEFDLQLARDSAAAAALIIEHVRLRDSLASTFGKLKESEQRFRSLSDAAFDGMVIHDGGRILVANLSEARMFGYDLNEIEGMSITKLVPPESLPMLAEKANAENITPFEILCVRKDGSTFWAEIRSREAYYEGKSVRVTSVRDVTERRQWEERKELAVRQERQARLEAEKAIRLRDDFLAIASHELKTPLTPLKLDLQIQRRYLRELGLPASRKTELLLQANDHADREYQRLSQLIDDLLDTSRIAAGRLPLNRVQVDLSALVKQVCGRFQPILAKVGSELTVEAEPGIVAWCDPGRIEQVLNNLLTNCQKYAAGKRVEVSLRAEADRGRLQVKDHGIGIAEEFHPTIFDRFVRAASIEHYGGLGLGLYIVKEIVEGHGGRVYLESELGKGTAFTVELPLQSERGL